jgi:hypothetical protein
MRTFGFDPKTKLPTLNGKTCWLRGTNLCIFRFFEDPGRGDRPWSEEWARRLHKAFRWMHFNAARYCIGFPPEKWYDVADETGLMIQDEFPVWYWDKFPPKLTSEELAREYGEWMRERWNHPSVIIWDAQNETFGETTGKAIRAVRGLDLSDRPWDNGDSPPQRPTDTYEAHPYLFQAWPPNTKATSFRFWDEAPKGGQKRKIPVVAINDLTEEWKGKVRLRLLQGNVALLDQSQEVRIAPAGQATVHFEVTLPAASEKLRFVAELVGYKGETVRSVREFTATKKP